MNKEQLSFEGVPEKKLVIEAIRGKGLDNPEALGLLTNWIDANQSKAEAGDSAPVSRIKFQVELAELLIAAGEIREGKDILFEQMDVAEEEGIRSTNPNPECAKLFEDIKALIENLG